MANGKAKGSGFERDVCKFLTSWLTGKPKPYIWWRMPASGAMATISEENKELSGDIISMRPEGAFLTDIFSIEAKCGYPKSNFHKHLKGNKNDEIRGFWEQAVNDASYADKEPMLVYKKTGEPILVGITDTFSSKYSELSILKSLTLKFDIDLPVVVFYDMKEFFEIITPELLKEKRK